MLLEGTHSITIKNGVIANIAKDGQGSGADEGTRIDVGGKFVSPGLIDAHVHVTAVPGVAVSRVSLAVTDAAGRFWHVWGGPAPTVADPRPWQT